MNRVISIMLTVALSVSVCGSAAGQHKNFILVLDPGHGGSDPGAVWGKYHEADLNLAVALALGELLEREMPDVDVRFTRRDDRKVGLAERGRFANKAGADLFLSIHANYAANTTASGTETYVMGMDKNEANLEVAKRENEVIKYEDDYTTTYAGFDPSSPEMAIALGMLQYANFEGSLRFARAVQKHYTAKTGRRDRGAKQNVFAVLWLPTMPRVLTEMGFISNPAEREYMFSKKGQEAIVRSLFEALGEYRAALGTEKPEGARVAENTAADKTSETKAADAKPAAAKSADAKADRRADKKADRKAAAAVPEGRFYVQLAASRSAISARDASWGAYRGKVVERREGGWYKYRTGPYPTADAAAKAMAEARRAKFTGAFVVEEKQ